MAGRYPAKAVANRIIDAFRNDDRDITQLQLQKLTYIAHGWHLAIDSEGDGMVAEPILAWKYGPVISALRDEFKEFGADPINRHASDVVRGYHVVVPTLQNEEAEEWEYGLVDWVYARYGHMNGPELIELTHRQGTPWAITTENGRNVTWERIPNDLIREHYRVLLRDYVPLGQAAD